MLNHYLPNCRARDVRLGSLRVAVVQHLVPRRRVVIGGVARGESVPLVDAVEVVGEVRQGASGGRVEGGQPIGDVDQTK